MPIFSSALKDDSIPNEHNLVVLGGYESVAEFLEGPADEDEARTEVFILRFSRSRTRPRVKYTNFRDRGRDEDLASMFGLFLGNLRTKVGIKSGLFSSLILKS